MFSEYFHLLLITVENGLNYSGDPGFNDWTNAVQVLFHITIKSLLFIFNALIKVIICFQCPAQALSSNLFKLVKSDSFNGE